MQKENPIEELKEKLTEQENEIRLLKELVVKGFKGMENMPSQSEKSVSPTATTAVEDETDKIKVTVDDASNDTENHTGPELPLPVPNLFQTLPYMAIAMYNSYFYNQLQLYACKLLATTLCYCVSCITMLLIRYCMCGHMYIYSNMTKLIYIVSYCIYVTTFET